MKKSTIITIAGILIFGLITPIIGMTISPTREILLGLSPEDSILKLADQIDTNRVSIDQKITELQLQVSSQQQTVDDQKKIIEDYQKQVDSVKSESKLVQESVSNETSCRKVQELFTSIPAKPSNGCSVMGPNNIVDMYKKINDNYQKYKDDDKSKDGDGDLLKDCYKSYLNVLKPAYDAYNEAKKSCN